MWAYQHVDRNDIMHYGVPGMKWGVRRYQNEDGTRTRLGKRVEDKANARMSKGKNLTSRQKKILKRMSEDDDRRINIKANAEAGKKFIEKKYTPWGDCPTDGAKDKSFMAKGRDKIIF